MNRVFSSIFFLLFCTAVSAADVRIVSLAPALTEIVCHLDGEKALVGRTTACEYPASVAKIPTVGRFGIPEIERIVALRPTLVIGNDLMNHNVVRKLRELNIEVELRQINTIDDYRYFVEFIGRKLGKETAAAQELARVEEQLQKLSAFAPADLKILWVVNAKPLMVAGPGSLPDMVIKLMKMQNAAGNAPAEYFKCSQEWLLNSQPDWVVWAAPGEPEAARGIWKNVPAVQQNRVIKNIDRSPVMCPGPRFLDEVLKMRSQIKPENAEVLSPNWHNQIWSLRLIRLLAAFTIGASLALSGMTFQAVLRNPLAEPFTLGISGGASVGAALAFVWGLNVLSMYAVPFMALVFALLLLAVVLLIAGSKGRENLLLSGVIAGTAASSVLMYLVSTAGSQELAGLTWWMLGDLQAVDTLFLYPAVGILLLGTLLLQYFGRDLNALALGDENAWSLGVNYRTSRLLLIAVASILAVQTVVMAGLIAFAGLIVPHLVRKFYGCDHRKIVLPMAWWGGVFLVICDILSRVVYAQSELPIGVLTAAIGGGVFIYLLNYRRKESDV